MADRFKFAEVRQKVIDIPLSDITTVFESLAAQCACFKMTFRTESSASRKNMV